MYACLVYFDLEESDVKVPILREWLTSWAMDAFSELDGLVLKAWFYNPVERQWGGLYIVEDMSVFSRLPQQEGSSGPLGRSPTQIIWGSLEGLVTGPGGPMGVSSLVGTEGRRLFRSPQFPAWVPVSGHGQPPAASLSPQTPVTSEAEGWTPAAGTSPAPR